MNRDRDCNFIVALAAAAGAAILMARFRAARGAVVKLGSRATLGTITQALRKEKRESAIVLFYADWCPNCAAAKAVFNRVWARWQCQPASSRRRVRFFQADVSDATGLAAAYSVETIPLVVVQRAKGVRHLSQNPAELERELEVYLGLGKAGQ